MSRYRVTEHINAGFCQRCGKKGRYGNQQLHVVKVVELKTSETEWRCNNCVRHLDSEMAHRLTEMDLRSLGFGIKR